MIKLKLDEAERAARAHEDHQDAELIRIAAYTGLRLGELLALCWNDVHLVQRRLVVHRAFSDRVEGPTKSWQARFLPIALDSPTAFDARWWAAPVPWRATGAAFPAG